MTFEKGDQIEIDGLVAVVVGIDTDYSTPEEHLTLWFGESQMKRVSEGGSGGGAPEVWTVPEVLYSKAAEPGHSAEL